MGQGETGHALPPACIAPLKVVTFFAGGQRCAVEARQVRALQPIIGEDSGNYPAVETLLGLSEQKHASLRRQVLTICQPESDITISVGAPVQLHEFAVDVIYPLPELLAARNQLRGLCALVMESKGLTMIFDLRTLCRDG